MHGDTEGMLGFFNRIAQKQPFGCFKLEVIQHDAKAVADFETGSEPGFLAPSAGGR